MRFALTTLAVSVALVAGCSNQGITTMDHNSPSQLIAHQTQAPVAKKVPHAMTIHGDTRIDDYYWMRDDERQDPEILQHLEQENQYAEAVLKHTEASQEQLFEEIKGESQKTTIQYRFAKAATSIRMKSQVTTNTPFTYVQKTLQAQTSKSF